MFQNLFPYNFKKLLSIYSKESACSAGDPGSIPGLGQSPGEGNGNPLQYSCRENPRDRGAWEAAVYRGAQSRTRLKWLRHFRMPLRPPVDLPHPGIEPGCLASPALARGSLSLGPPGSPFYTVDPCVYVNPKPPIYSSLNISPLVISLFSSPLLP